MARSDSEPLLRGSINDTARSLLASAKDDGPESGARDRMLVALAAAPSANGGRLRELLRAGGPSIYGLAIALVLSVGASLAVSASWNSASTVGEVTVARERGREATREERRDPAAPLASGVPDDGAANAFPFTVIPVVALDALPDAPVSGPTPNPRVSSKGSQPAAPALTVPSAPRESTLAREIAKVEAARTSLAVGDGPRTLIILDQYDREFPTGAFAVEISVLRIEALARAGRTEEARRLGSEFLEAHSHGAFARRVSTTLDTMKTLRAVGSD